MSAGAYQGPSGVGLGRIACRGIPRRSRTKKPRPYTASIRNNLAALYFAQGDTNGRRDYVHLYEVDKLKATVKQNMKIHWPPPGVNPAMAKIFNLYWDPREDNPLLFQGVWAGTPFVRMYVQHLRMKDKWPDWEPARGMPYEDVENLRPETKAMVQMWAKTYGDAKDVILGVEAAGN